MSSGFNESNHPRVPAGSTAGGQFTSSGFPADNAIRDGIYDEQSLAVARDSAPVIDDATAGALYNYIGRGDYEKMNRALRSNPRKMNKMLEGNEPENEGVNKDLHRIQQILKEPLDAPVIVYRATDLPPKAIAKLDTPGSQLRLAGFLSTSADPATATGFGMPNMDQAAKDWGHGKYLLEIKAKQGRFLEESAETELLLPHGSKFKVAGRKTVKMRVNPGRMYEQSRQPIREVEIIQLEQVTI